MILVCMVVYNLNLKFLFPHQVGDTTPNRVLPFAILSGNGFYLDDFVGLMKANPYETYYVTKFASHYLSTFPITTGVMALPFYVPAYLFLKATNNSDAGTLYLWSFWLEKLAAGVMATVSVVVMYYLIKKISGKVRVAVIFSLIFAFATQTFSISSQYLWQHGPANLWLALSLLCVFLGYTHEKGWGRGRWLILSTLFSIVSFFMRLTFVLFAIILLVAIHVSEKRGRWVYWALLMTGGLLLVLFNITFYQSIVGGYKMFAHQWEPSNYLAIFLSLLVSPSRGLLFYTPFFLFSLLAIMYWRNIKRLALAPKIVFCISYAYAVCLIAVNSFHNWWWSGHSWGNRYLTDIAVPATVLLYYFFHFCRIRFLRVVAILSIVYSVFTQIVGVFYYPRGLWDEYPVDIDQATGRLWNLQDNPLLRNVLMGLDLSGYYRAYYYVTGQRGVFYQVNQKKCGLKQLARSKRMGYSTVLLSLTNLSTVDWITTGEYPLTFVQITPQDQGGLVPATLLPPVIESGQTAFVTLIFPHYISVPEGTFVTLTQDWVNSWSDYCQVEII